MEKCNVELVSSIIRELKLSVGHSSYEKSEICVSYNFKACDPIDPTDPTIMVIADVTVEDASVDRIDAKFTLETIFRLDPIPADRKAVANAQCSEIVQEKAMHMLQALLTDAGHKIVIHTRNRTLG